MATDTLLTPTHKQWGMLKSKLDRDEHEEFTKKEWGELWGEIPDYGTLYTTDHPEGIPIESEEDFLALGATESPNATTPLTFSFGTVARDTVTGFEFGKDYVETIPRYFLNFCSNLNSPMNIPEGVTVIEQFFLCGCTGFNSPVTIPNTVTAIGNQYNGWFMSGDTALNSTVTLPDSITWIGTYFMNGCSAFNQPIHIPSGLTAINSCFMSNCTKFNQPLVFPDDITTIDDSFMQHNTSFNSVITLPTNLRTIDDWFMWGCTSFAQPLTVPSRVRSVGNFFLCNCNNFIGPLYCEADLSNYYELVSSQNTLGAVLATHTSSAKMYRTGVTLMGTYRARWKSNFANRSSSPYRKLIQGSA